jgi:WD40 repeat protein
MKKAVSLILFIAITLLTTAAIKAEPLQYNGKIGFVNGEDIITFHRFFDNDKKLLVIGAKTVQLWDVETRKMISTATHSIEEFKPVSIWDVLNPKNWKSLLKYEPVLFDPEGQWMIATEKSVNSAFPKKNVAVARDLKTLKETGRLELPEASIDWLYLDEERNEIVATGKLGEKQYFSFWDRNDFQHKRTFAIDQYKWHTPIKKDSKIIVGSGTTKILWNRPNIKFGDTLTLRDAKTLAIEKEYTAENLKPETTYENLSLSQDERFLIAKRYGRVYVWEIDGGGKPKFEIGPEKPKGEIGLNDFLQGRYLVITEGEDVRIYDVEGNGAPKLKIAPVEEKSGLRFAGVLSGRYPAVYEKGRLRIYDLLGGGEPLFQLTSDKKEDKFDIRDATEDAGIIVVSDDAKLMVLDTARPGKPVFEVVRSSEKERFNTVMISEQDNWLLVSRENKSEKMPPRTEVYDLKSGKKEFEMPAAIILPFRRLSGGKYFIFEGIGATSVWNISKRTAFSVPLKTHTFDNDDEITGVYGNDETVNVEDTLVSPNNRFLIKLGRDLVTLYEMETGKQLQILFDAQTAQYDKQKRLKDSGLGDGQWSADGHYFYALEDGGLLKKARVINLWQVAN